MKYKPGDEVLIKAEVTDVSGYECSERPYFVAPDTYSVNWVSKDKIIPMGKAYEMGLNDAWQLAKKIYDMKCDAIEEIFGVKGGFYEVIRNFTFEDCRDKIEAYEKENEIKVGDVMEIFHNGGKGVVVRILAEDGLNIVLENGLFYADCSRGDCVKTGKHIDIESLLRQIGE